MTQSSTEAGWRVISAEFETSATGLDNAPPALLPEIAVGGRSNVGKSSLLNAFARRTGLARVSRTPGRTRLLNCFRIRLRGPEGDRELRWVDLPGYGFAAAARPIRESFGPMIESYLLGRETLRAFLLLVDARRGIREEERELLELMGGRGVPTLLVITKCDKLGASERGLLARRMAAPLGIDPRDILLTSSSKGIGLGDDPRKGGLAHELAMIATPEDPSEGSSDPPGRSEDPGSDG